MTNTIKLHGTSGKVIANLIPSLTRKLVTNHFTGETSEHTILRAVDGPYRYVWDLTLNPITTDEIGVAGGMRCSGLLGAISSSTPT